MNKDQSMSHRLWINYRLWFKQYEIYEISDKPIFVCQSISQLKRKVVELSTGDKKVEEWKFLPRDWKHCYVKKPIICKTFLFMEFFHRIENLRMNTGDILILNLVTRKKFWMWKEILTTQIKEKAAGRIDFVERFGRREVYYNLRPERSGYFLPEEIFRLVRLVSHSVKWLSKTIELLSIIK